MLYGFFFCSVVVCWVVVFSCVRCNCVVVDVVFCVIVVRSVVLRVDVFLFFLLLLCGFVEVLVRCRSVFNVFFLIEVDESVVRLYGLRMVWCGFSVCLMRSWWLCLFWRMVMLFVFDEVLSVVGMVMMLMGGGVLGSNVRVVFVVCLIV